MPKLIVFVHEFHPYDIMILILELLGSDFDPPLQPLKLNYSFFYYTLKFLKCKIKQWKLVKKFQFVYNKKKVELKSLQGVQNDLIVILVLNNDLTPSQWQHVVLIKC